MVGTFLVFGLAWAAGPAAAQDTELRLYREPASFTDVVDAFDDEDPFDLNLSIGYLRSQTSGTVVREANITESRDGRATQNGVDIADFEHVTNSLVLGLDVGLYHDLAAFFRLPIVLSDTRSLRVPDGADVATVRQRLEVTEIDPDTMMPVDRPLFNVPFESQERSGIDHFEAGLAWAIFNQYRDPEYPTWVIMASGRFGIGEPMHACGPERYGDDRRTPEPAVEDQRCNGGEDPGISEGTNALVLETRASWRGRYVEPFAGLSFSIAWPGSADEFFAPGGDLKGFMNTLPSRVGELTAGLAVIPWEQRARWQRFLLDLRLVGTYVSEGHSYSPLFDALGTSQSEYLREPNLECPDCLRQVAFTGLTDTESHGRIGGRFALEMQAARYVRFVAGVGLAWSTPYNITYADACNPNIDPDPADPRIGTCRSGIINPHHRSVVDLPGQRFRVDSEMTVDIFATAIGQF